MYACWLAWSSLRLKSASWCMICNFFRVSINQSWLFLPGHNWSKEKSKTCESPYFIIIPSSWKLSWDVSYCCRDYCEAIHCKSAFNHLKLNSCCTWFTHFICAAHSWHIAVFHNICLWRGLTAQLFILFTKSCLRKQ